MVAQAAAKRASAGRDDGTVIAGPIGDPAARARRLQRGTPCLGRREKLLRDEEMLAALGYEPVGFQRRADEIVACRISSNRFEAAVVSHGETGPNGLHLACALHEPLQRPILFATAPAIDVNPDAMAEAGIAEVLSRPLVSSELAAALARCLRPTGILQA
jgi:hypothetical protein